MPYQLPSLDADPSPRTTTTLPKRHTVPYMRFVGPDAYYLAHVEGAYAIYAGEGAASPDLVAVHVPTAEAVGSGKDMSELSRLLGVHARVMQRSAPALAEDDIVVPARRRWAA